MELELLYSLKDKVLIHDLTVQFRNSTKADFKKKIKLLFIYIPYSYVLTLLIDSMKAVRSFNLDKAAASVLTTCVCLMFVCCLVLYSTVPVW